MSEQEQNNIDTAIREKEIAFKEREIALREQEAQAKIELDKRGIWFSSPLLIGIFSAIFGLLGTGIGAALQGYSSLQLERQKFESSLMQKALEIKDRNEAAKTLLFLVDSGVIQSLDGERIRKIAENPEQLPSLTQLLVATGRGGAIASSPDGKTFLVGDADGSVTLWSVNGKILTRLPWHTNAVTSVIYSPDNQRIFTGSLDKNVNIWDLSTGKQLSRLPQKDGVIGLAISSDGKILIVRMANNEIAQWDLATQKQLRLIQITSSQNLEQDLDAVNIDFSDSALSNFLGKPFSNYPQFAEGCLKLLENQRLKGKVYFDVLFWTYTEELEGQVDSTSPNGNLDEDRLKTAMVRAYNTRNGSNLSSFEDIVESKR